MQPSSSCEFESEDDEDINILSDHGYENSQADFYSNHSFPKTLFQEQVGQQTFFLSSFEDQNIISFKGH